MVRPRIHRREALVTGVRGVESMIRILFAVLMALSLLDTAAAQDKIAPVPQTQEQQAASEERWPRAEISDEVRAEIKEKFGGLSSAYHDSGYKASGAGYKSFLAGYRPFGDYLRWSQRTYTNDGELVLDAAGMPMVLHNGVPYYNPVTLSHYCLTLHGRLINGDARARTPFLAAVRKLISLQSANGEFRYPIQLKHHHFTLEPGWISGMAQGNALSVFARALQIDSNAAFRRAGELALAALLRTTAEGGPATTLADLDPSLRKYIFFEEYPSKPVNYTLNGFMFTLLGLYDWGQVKAPSSAQAAQAFASGMTTLEKILPLYDVDGISTYDLSHIISRQKPYTPTAYLAIHLYVLHALNSIHPTPKIESFEKR
jgi:heparosan-N-sulfate-glucuronate 5-epimerase